MKVKYLASLLTVCGLFSFSTRGQCDLVLTDVNLEAGTFTIEFLNTTSCGGTGGPDGVSEIQIGFHALDPDNDCASMNQGWIFPSGYGLSATSNHPGWIFSGTSAELPLSNWTNLWPDWPWDIDPPYYAGETITFPLYNQYQSDCVNGPFVNSSLCNLEGVLNYWIDEGYSVEAVIWQISYGPTMYAEDGGWAEVGPNGDGTSTGTGIYDDENFEDNIFIVGPCADPSPGPDAIVTNIEFNIGCIGDIPTYSLDYQVVNLGDEVITNYCIEIWNEDYYQCFDSDLFGAYEIPPGEGQSFTTPFFQYEGGSSIFVVSVDSVNGTDEIVTGNNNTTVYYPEFPTCPIECLTDTIYEIEVYVDTLTIVDVVDSLIFIYDTTYVDNFIYDTTYVDNFIYDTTYIELPPDTLILTQIDTLYIELPPDTIILTEIDTIYVPWEWYIYDTVYVDNYIYDTTYVEIELPPDTITVTEIITEIDTITVTETEIIFVTDTVFETDIIYLTDTLYITLIDTIIEYQFIEIDCSTGLPCSDLGFEQCDPLTAFIPNTFTPNNDGFNDVWEIIIDPNCWTDVDAHVYNRWGTLVWESYDPYYLQWNGSNMGGSYYVPDGVYYWTFSGRKINTTVIEELQGHVTIFR
jgi:gliding motility-associated-like protein